ncbi:MAG: TetR/AcrR family transcriptional regulator [Clostridia bacterium]|nr:TetR/AcrR family transcriptional regulator [Clostridia bacterium]
MPPNVKITKQDIINTAIDIVRKSGVQAINARQIASALNCSTQPIFSNFVNMDELRLEIVKKAEEICGEYIQREINSGKFPDYKASGMAYIRFAKEEKELFKILYMRDRTNENISQPSKLDDKMQSFVQKYTGLDEENAKQFHFGMWAYVHGIASMIATGFENPDLDIVSRMLTNVYQGMRKQYEMEQ